MGMKKPTSAKLRRLARWTAAAAVILSVWLFGSAEPWAYLFISILAQAGAALWLLALISDPRMPLRAPVLVVILIAILAFGLFQVAPLGGSLTEAASPLSAKAHARAVEILQKSELTEFLPSGSQANTYPATISASPPATWRSLYLFAAYLSVLVVMACTFTKWSQVRRVAAAFVASSFLLAVIGMIHKFSGDRSIFWFHTPRFGGAIFGSFTNPNHYAAYMNMAFAVTLGLLLASIRTSEDKHKRTWREKLARLSTRKGSRVVLLGFASAVIGASVFVSLSRGAIASLAGSLGLVGGVVTVGGASRKRGRILAAVALLIAAVVVWVGWQPVVKELGTIARIDPANSARMEASLATLRLFDTSPVFGCGFGAFEYVFPIFQAPAIQIGRWTHAHNDYAQLLAEGGLTGAALAALAIAAFVFALWRRFPKAVIQGKAFVSGLAVGMMAIALHSAVDFSIHKPACAFLLAAVCGMSIAAVHVKSRKKKRIGHRRNNEVEKTLQEQPV